MPAREGVVAVDEPVAVRNLRADVAAFYRGEQTMTVETPGEGRSILAHIDALTRQIAILTGLRGEDVGYAQTEMVGDTQQPTTKLVATFDATTGTTRYVDAPAVGVKITDAMIERAAKAYTDALDASPSGQRLLDVAEGRVICDNEWMRVALTAALTPEGAR